MYLSPNVPSYLFEIGRQYNGFSNNDLPSPTPNLYNTYPSYNSQAIQTSQSPISSVDAFSIYGYLASSPYFTKVTEVIRTAKLDNYLSDPQTYVTIFVPRDVDFHGQLRYSERDMILFSTAKAKIYLEEFINAKTRLETLHPYDNLEVVSQYNGLFINDLNTMIIAGNIEATNGMIHIINRPLQPLTPI